MKIMLTDGRITTVTNEKGRELIASGAGVEYTGDDPEDAAVKAALQAPEKPAEKIEVVHRYLLDEEE